MIKTLIVEDEFLVRLGLKSVIDWEKEGFSIVGEAANGEEALALYHQHRPGLIVTDIKMPKKDGLTLMKEIRAEDRAVRFIVLTAYNEFAYAKKSIEVGVEAYLLKGSILNDELTAALQKLRPQLSGAAPGAPGEARAREAETLLEAIQNHLPFEELPGWQGGSAQVGCVRLAAHHDRALQQSLSDLAKNTLAQKQQPALVLPQDDAFLVVLPAGEAAEGTLAAMAEAVLRYLGEGVFAGLSLPAGGKDPVDRALRQARTACEQNVIAPAAPPVQLYRKAPPTDHAHTDAWVLSLERALLDSDETAAAALLLEMQGQIAASGSVKQLHRVVYRAVLVLTRHYDGWEEGETVRRLLALDTLPGIFSALSGLFAEVCRQMPSLLPQNSLHVEKAKLFIRQNIAANIKLRDVSVHIHLSPNYLGKLFFSETGQYLTDYILDEKIAAACPLLRRGEGSIADVAQQVGIPDQQYFSKLFKKKMGLSPKEYAAQPEK